MPFVICELPLKKSIITTKVLHRDTLLSPILLQLLTTGFKYSGQKVEHARANPSSRSCSSHF